MPAVREKRWGVNLSRSPCGPERVLDANAVVVLPVAEVFGKDGRASRRAGGFQNERVPVRDAVLLGSRGRRDDEVRSHWHDRKTRELFERTQCLRGPEWSFEPPDIDVELVEDLRGQDDVVGRGVIRKEPQGYRALLGLVLVLGIDKDVGVEKRKS